MIGKILAGVVAVVCAAGLTLATMIALVVIGTVLLLGCIYLATHLAVRILGVGNAEFPPLPDSGPINEPRPGNPPKN
jgi:hypothetical protein